VASLHEPFKKDITDESDAVMMWRSKNCEFEKEIECSEDEEDEKLLSKQPVVIEHRTQRGTMKK
jgi:hypothetical protein